MTSLTFNIVHFPNFEINAALEQAPHLTVSKFYKRRKRLLEEIRYSFSEQDSSKGNSLEAS